MADDTETLVRVTSGEHAGLGVVLFRDHVVRSPAALKGLLGIGREGLRAWLRKIDAQATAKVIPMGRLISLGERNPNPADVPDSSDG